MEQNIPPQSAEIFNQMTNDLEGYLDQTDQDRQETGMESRANLLDSTLKNFSSINSRDREKILPLIQRFIMEEISVEGEGRADDPHITIDTAVLERLADPEKSADLKRYAEKLKEITFITSEADEINLFRGTYEVTELGEDGSVQAHAVNSEGGGSAHSNLGTLARFSLFKALLGHHLELSSKEFSDWRSTNIKDNLAYFKKRVQLEDFYIGNHGRMGSSGAEMTEARINVQSGGVLDKNELFWDFFQAGSADSLACEAITTMRSKDNGGDSIDNFSMYLPDDLDTEKNN